MRYVKAIECEVISLGRQGENNVETVWFDVSGWAEQYGVGAFELLHERCLDTAPYSCPITVSDGVVSWLVRNTDTAYAGRGQAELIYAVNGAVAKSTIYQTNTLRAVDGDADFPDPYDDWLRQMHEDAEFCRENMAEALEAKKDAEAWAVGTRDGEPVEEDDPAYHNSSLYHSQQSGLSATAAALSAQQAAAFVGSPFTANLESEMTDHTKVYVYTGSEVGMNNGDWYFWNGTAWTDGGIYNAVAINVASVEDYLEALYS